jgi:hypothetical protein
MDGGGGWGAKLRECEDDPHSKPYTENMHTHTHTHTHIHTRIHTHTHTGARQTPVTRPPTQETNTLSLSLSLSHTHTHTHTHRGHTAATRPPTQEQNKAWRDPEFTKELQQLRKLAPPPPPPIPAGTGRGKGFPPPLPGGDSPDSGRREGEGKCVMEVGGGGLPFPPVNTDNRYRNLELNLEP